VKRILKSSACTIGDVLAREASVLVNIAPMADFKNQNYDAIFFEAANQAIVLYPIAPKAGEITAQRLAEFSGVFRPGETLPQIAKDRFLNSRVKFS
jgi:hypothetical protein